MVTPSVTRSNQVIAQDSVLYLLKMIGTEKALSCYNDLSKGLFPEVDVNPHDYDNAYSYLLDAQAVALFKKATFADFGIDTKAASIKQWHDSEAKCKEFNDLLTDKAYLRDLSKNVSGILYTAREYLRRLLGPVPLLTTVRFGPGSTAHSRGFFGSLPNKLESDTGIYSHTPLSYFKTLFESNPLFYESLGYSADCEVFVGRFKRIDYDVYSTVAKTAKTDRGISLGASLNMVLQLNVHEHVIKRLKRWGIDLPYVPELHKSLAKQASIDGSLATIDLRAASDSISRELVRSLLPDDWYRLLDDIRARKTRIDENVYELNKFCAMGCGFTFVLETIIFMAITWATAQIDGHKLKTMSVFGDDIIVDTALANSLIKNLGLLGFETNKEKTFVTGRFRESCGGDFFDGIEVRPIYWKNIPDEKTEGLYKIANRVRETLHRLNLNGYCSLDGYPLWESIISYIPENLRFFGPHSCGDRVLTSTRAEWIGYASYRNQQLRVPCLGRAYDRKGRARPRKRYGKLAYYLYKLGYSASITENSTVKLPLYLTTGISDSVTDTGQIMPSTGYKVVKRRAFVYYTCSDESFAWR